MLKQSGAARNAVVVVFRATGGAPILQQSKVKVRHESPRVSADSGPSSCPKRRVLLHPEPSQVSLDSRLSKLVLFLRKQLKTDSVVSTGVFRWSGRVCTGAGVRVNWAAVVPTLQLAEAEAASIMPVTQFPANEHSRTSGIATNTHTHTLSSCNNFLVLSKHTRAVRVPARVLHPLHG